MQQPPSARTLLSVEDLHVAYPDREGRYGDVVRGVSFTLGRERLGIVGESGSGKSQTGRAILGLSAPGARVSARQLSFDGIPLLTCAPAQRRALRGGRIAMVLQDPKFSLDPVMNIGAQIAETLQAHAPMPARQQRERVLQALAAVGIDNPARMAGLYPHEVSGGMGQRAMIAMMLAMDPALLIADEPTSALDVTVQVEILALLQTLVKERGMALLLVSHDLRMVEGFCDRVIVMHQGRIVDQCTAAELSNSTHPYTRRLLDCVPALEKA